MRVKFQASNLKPRSDEMGWGGQSGSSSTYYIIDNFPVVSWVDHAFGRLHSHYFWRKEGPGGIS
jgi:hypothetical protein